MPRYNPQWENQIKGYRKRRVLLVAKSLPFKATRSQVESAMRARLTKPDSAIFLWPPGANRPGRHIGWVMLAFSERPETKMALEELQNFEIHGRPIDVARAHREARLPNPSYAARNSASATNNDIITAAATATTTTTTAATTTTTASAVSAAAPSLQTAPTEDAAARDASDSLEETHVPSRDFEWWW